MYEYDEDDGEVSDIAVMINTSIAQDLSINVAGGKYKLWSVMNKNEWLSVNVLVIYMYIGELN